jgi:excisionase family DNA binding protein
MDALLQKLVEQQAEILLNMRELRNERELPQQEWFSIFEAAALTGLSDDHIRRAVVGGTLPASNVGTPDRPIYRISKIDIGEWMEKRKAGALPTPRRKKRSTQEPTGALPFSPHLPRSKQPTALAS